MISKTTIKVTLALTFAFVVFCGKKAVEAGFSDPAFAWGLFAVSVAATVIGIIHELTHPEPARQQAR